MTVSTKVKKDILSMFMAHPYPRWTKEERRQRFAGILTQFTCLGLSDAMPGARFLDVGCGTANRCMLAAKHFGVREYVGIDHSTASLEIARAVAAEESFDRFVAVEGDLFSIPYPDASFDVVMCQGVLMTTTDPFRGLKELVRVCRPGGLVAIYVYNTWNHWRHNLQKNRVTRLAGEDFEERFAVAHRLYGTKPIDAMTEEEIATFYDQYCIPYKSEHSVGEVLSWFDELGLEYWGSAPPLRFRDLISAAQFRAELEDEYPMFSSLGRSVIRASKALPSRSATAHPWRRPTPLHRFLFQLGFAWQGRHGEYSGGAGFAVRKPLA
jgi:ubiquinone/menaquinone biosynthesis C-methylase UbiE